VAANQAEHTTQYNGFDLGAVVAADHTAAGLLGVGRNVLTADQANGPVLHRFGNRGNRMVTHCEGGQPMAQCAI